MKKLNEFSQKSVRGGVLNYALDPGYWPMLLINPLVKGKNTAKLPVKGVVKDPLGGPNTKGGQTKSRKKR